MADLHEFEPKPVLSRLAEIRPDVIAVPGDLFENHVLYTLAGPEISVATTKAYSAQLVAVDCLAVQFAFVRGVMTEEQYSYYISELLTLPDKISRTLEDKGRIQCKRSIITHQGQKKKHLGQEVQKIR